MPSILMYDIMGKQINLDQKAGSNCNAAPDCDGA